MKKQVINIILFTCCCVFTTRYSMATEDIRAAQQSEMDNESTLDQAGGVDSEVHPFEFVLKAGSRQDALNWNIAGGAVNILSELKWESIKIAQTVAAAKYNFYSDWSLRGMLSYGRIISGNIQDSDYNGNNRTQEFSRSNNNAAGGYVRDASISLGRAVQISPEGEKNSLWLTPLVGLSRHQQHLRMTDGFQTLPATGSFPGLNSTYDTQWQGPWAGLEATLNTQTSWSLSAKMEYHWVGYTANANWNLRREFAQPVSFIHYAQGRGVLLELVSTYRINKAFKFLFAAEKQQWRTGAGLDRTYFSNGTIEDYRLNEVNWNSSALNLGLVVDF